MPCTGQPLYGDSGGNPAQRDHSRTRATLGEDGKAKMVALIATMRKLMRICSAVLKHQTPFQASPIEADT